MTNLISEFTADYPQNPVLLYMITNQQGGTANPLSVNEYINTVWPTDLFPKVEILKKDYGELPYVKRQFLLEDYQKENDWVKLVGTDFYTLSEEKRQFLTQTAGIIKFEKKIDIKKFYDTGIY